MMAATTAAMGLPEVQQDPTQVSGLLGRERLPPPSSQAQVISQLLGSENIPVWLDCHLPCYGAPLSVLTEDKKEQVNM